MCCPWWCRARSGGLVTQLLWAWLHISCHLCTAITLMLLVELGTETCIRCGHLQNHMHLVLPYLLTVSADSQRHSDSASV